MEGVLAAFAQFDNDVRSDRTRGGMKEASPEMTPGKCNARSGLQVLLEPHPAALIGELHDEVYVPRPVLGRVRATTFVVDDQSPREI
jgi:hypothetical protein